MGDRDAVRAYYRALDDHTYETFDSLLTADFDQDRPDRTLEGRERFVAFMRDERPLTRTTHDLQDFYENDGGEILVRGTLRNADGEALFEFVDRHVFDGDRIAHVETFTAR